MSFEYLSCSGKGVVSAVELGVMSVNATPDVVDRRTVCAISEARAGASMRSRDRG